MISTKIALSAFDALCFRQSFESNQNPAHALWAAVVTLVRDVAVSPAAADVALAPRLDDKRILELRFQWSWLCSRCMFRSLTEVTRTRRVMP